MAKVHRWAVQNGEIIAAEAIRLSPFQTGLLSGWGLFSTLRIYHGVPFALEDHLARLRADAQRLRVAAEEALEGLPEAFRRLIEANAAEDRPAGRRRGGSQADGAAGTANACPTGTEANDSSGFEAMARVYIIRNHGGLLDRPGGRAADWLIFTADLRDWGAAAKLKVIPHGRHAAAPLAAVKSLSWAANLALLEQAQAQGFDDALLLNERGEVAECTSANVFAARGGALLTPALDSGALAGVSRKVILDGCRQAGIPVREAAMRVADLLAAEEAFITSSTREVQPVSHLDATPLPPPGAMTEKVREIFRRAVEDYTAKGQGTGSAATTSAGGAIG